MTPTVIELGSATLIAPAGTVLVASRAVAGSTSAGSADVSFYIFGTGLATPTGQKTYLEGADYPALENIWDNDDDAVFDTL